MKDLMGMIPGMGKALKELDIDDDAFKHIEAMINSMTTRRAPKSRYHQWLSSQTYCQWFWPHGSRCECSC
jgi:hypothetical protein